MVAYNIEGNIMALERFIRIRLAGEAAAKKGIKEIDGAIRKTGDSVTKMGKDFLKLGAAIGVAGAALGAYAKLAGDAGKELKNQAALSNSSVKAFQAQAAAAKVYGIEQQKVADISKDFQDRVGDFLQTGAGPLTDFFENIAPTVGITAKELKGLAGIDGLVAVTSAMEKAGLSSEEMTFHYEALAGDVSFLTPLLADGGAELKRLTENYNALNFALSQTEVDQLSEISDRFSMMAEEATKLSQADIASFFNDERLNDIEDGFDAILTAMRKIEAVTGILIDDFGSLSTDGSAEFGALAHAGGETAKFLGNAFANFIPNMKSAIEALTVGAASGFDKLKAKATVSLGLISSSFGAFKAFVTGGDVKAIITDFENMVDAQRQVIKTADMVSSDMIDNILAERQAHINANDEKLQNELDTIKAMSDARKAARVIERAQREKESEEVKSSPTEDDSTGGGTARVKRVQDVINANKLELEAIQIHNQTKLDEDATFSEQKVANENARYEQEIAVLSERGISESEKAGSDMAAQAELSFQNQELMKSAQLDHERNITAIKKAESDAGKSQAIGDAQFLLGHFAQNSKKAFKVQKAASLTQATVKGYESATSAWAAGMATGGPWAPAVAAAYTGASLLKTGVQIKKISSMKFGGGGGGGGSGGGGGIPSPSASGSGNQQASELQRSVTEVRTSGNQEIIDELNSLDAEFIPVETVRKIASAIDKERLEGNL